MNTTEVDIPVAGNNKETIRTLPGTFFPSNGESQAPVQTLFIHGLGSSRKGYQERARVVAENGSDVLTFDLSRPGLRQRDYFADVIAAYDSLKARNADSEIAVCGASYGGYLAALINSFREVGHLLLRAPALVGEKDHLKIEAPLKHFLGSLWLVLSEDDEEFSPEDTDRYWNAAQQAKLREKVIIPKADHSLSTVEARQTYLEVLRTWSQSLKQ